MDDFDDVNKVTIVPRGDAGGLTIFSPNEENMNSGLSLKKPKDPQKDCIERIIIDNQSLFKQSVQNLIEEREEVPSERNSMSLVKKSYALDSSIFSTEFQSEVRGSAVKVSKV